MMDMELLIVFAIVAVLLISLAYVYERGWRSGYAEGKQIEPYKLITQG